jgi:hypothetical protein
MSTVLPNYLEWYEVDGVELATHGYAISTITKGHAARKGTNVDTPSMHGTQFREKRLDVRNETWNLWVTDTHPVSGSVATTEKGRRSQFNYNMDTIMQLVNKMPELLEVKHYKVDPENPDVTQHRIAHCEIVSAFNIDDYKELNIAQFGLDVMFPDPRWYSDDIASASASLASGTSGTYTLSEYYTGTAPATYMTITITATGSGVTNPRFSNITYPNSTQTIGYNGVLTAGQKAVFDTEQLTLKDGSGVNKIANLYRHGSRQSWFELFPVENTLVIAADSGTCRVELSYRKAYF